MLHDITGLGGAELAAGILSRGTGAVAVVD